MQQAVAVGYTSTSRAIRRVHALKARARSPAAVSRTTPIRRERRVVV